MSPRTSIGAHCVGASRFVPNDETAQKGPTTPVRIKGFALPPRIPGAVLDSTIGRGFCPEAARRLGDHADENDATARTSPSALGRPRGSLPTWSDFASHRMWDASSKLPSGKWATLDSTRRSERALYRPSADSDVEGLAQAQPRNEAAPQVRVPTDCPHESTTSCEAGKAGSVCRFLHRIRHWHQMPI